MRQWSMIVFAAIVILAAVTAVSISSRRASVETEREAYKAELRGQGELLNFGELDSVGTGDGRVDLSRFEAAAARLPTGDVGFGDLAIMRYAGPGMASVGWLADRPPFNVYVTNSGITWDDLIRWAEEAAGLRRELVWSTRSVGSITGTMGGDRLSRGTWAWPAGGAVLVIQPILEQVRSLAADEPMAEVKSELDNLEIALDRANDGWFSGRQHELSLMALPIAQRAIPQAVEREAQRRLTIVALALARYSRAYGNPPASLELLVPEFLQAVPIDPLAGEPIRYRLHSDGTFTLYSVGRDGLDDGGDPTLMSSAKPTDLWDGRDAVWPTAGSGEND